MGNFSYYIFNSKHFFLLHSHSHVSFAPLWNHSLSYNRSLSLCSFYFPLYSSYSVNSFDLSSKVFAFSSAISILLSPSIDYFFKHIIYLLVVECPFSYFYIIFISLLRFPIFLSIVNMFCFTSLRLLKISTLKSLISSTDTWVISGLLLVDFLFYWQCISFICFFMCQTILNYILGIMNVKLLKLWILLFFPYVCYFFCFTSQLFYWNWCQILFQTRTALWLSPGTSGSLAPYINI